LKFTFIELNSLNMTMS